MNLEKDVDNWLIHSQKDLESANVLYENKLYSQALYHAQQSNEKLVKALLLQIGVLKTDITPDNFQIKLLLGFSPKPPSRYRHRTIQPFLSDLKKFTIAIQEIVESLKKYKMDEKMVEFQKSIKRSNSFWLELTIFI